MISLNKKELGNTNNLFENQLIDLFESSIPQISDILPSEWTEQNLVMQKPFPGPFKYSKTPYTRELIDCLSSSSPVNTITVMKGAQIGFSSGVIFPGIAWIIANSPGNTFLSVGAPDLIDKAMEKVDLVIDSCGIRPLIKTQVQRKKNNKTGDTNKKKDFSGGFLIVGSANNHKNIRQIDLQYQFIDDMEAIKKASKESGSTRKKLESRSAAYNDTKKTFYISTPELAENSNIEDAYEQGDKRKYFIPCPCCGSYITIEWSIESKLTPNKLCGITWSLKENGQVAKESVGYTCQECDEFFTDKDKMDWLNHGEWKPTAVAKKENYRSYHISALYAPIGMDDWYKYVCDYVDAHPVGQPRDESLYQVFVNECLGETYKSPGTSIKSSDLQLNNVRAYKIGLIPEKQSILDGNGRIVLLTCSADLGGLVTGINSDHDDVRLDWEIVAWTESGSSYSIDQGSIGTFKNAYLGKQDESREIWSYDISKQNNVWKEFSKIISQQYDIDGTGKKMSIGFTGIDTGFAEHHAFNFIDRCNYTVVGLKGDKEHKYIPFGDNSPNWKRGTSRSKLYILKVGKLKDQLAQRISLRWDKRGSDAQPQGYLNFPQPEGGKYSLQDYFLHFESEERKLDKNNNFIWQKKSGTQNHFWDVHNYQMALREILMDNVMNELKIKNGTWPEFCDLILRARS